MNVSQFRQVLLDACLITSAVDGDVDESELAVIRDAMTKTLVGEDEIQERTEKLAEVAASFKANTEQRRTECLSTLNSTALTDGQRRRLIVLCCQIASADRVFEPAEAEWLRSVIGACGITVAEAVSLCPKHAAILRILADEATLRFRRRSLEVPPDVADLGSSIDPPQG